MREKYISGGRYNEKYMSGSRAGERHMSGGSRSSEKYMSGSRAAERQISGGRSNGKDMVGRSGEKYISREKRSGKAFGFLTVLLVLIIIFCVKGTVMSREKKGCERNNHYYAALEQEFVNSARKTLEGQGLHDCGLDLRWVADENGSREYTILIHHRRLDRMNGEDKAALADLLSAAEFQEETCTFQYVFG